MLRPRRDVEVLIPADSFGWNLVRAYLELVAMLALLIAFGVFLGAGLGRPVALFVALVTLVVGEMSPSVVEQYQDPLEGDSLDRVGLVLARFAAEFTHPITSLSPSQALAGDECIETADLLRVLAVDLLAVPLLLALLAALAMPLKQEDS